MHMSQTAACDTLLACVCSMAFVRTGHVQVGSRKRGLGSVVSVRSPH